MTTKTKALVRTILDKNIRDEAMLRINNALKDCWRLVYAENADDPENKSKNKARSSAKTDALHKVMVEVLGLSLGPFLADFSFVAETDAVSGSDKGKTKKISVIDLFGDKFNLDGSISSPTGELFAAILLKAPLQSIQKNRKNAIGHSFGEVMRLMSPTFTANPRKRLITIPMVPIQTFCESGGAFKVEECHNIFLSSLVNGGLGKTILEASCIDASVKSRIHEIPVLYALDFGDIALQDIKNKFDLRAAMAAADEKGHSFIKIEESALDFIAVFVQEFLAGSGNPVHAAYLAANSKKMVARPDLPSPKIVEGDKKKSPRRKSVDNS